MKLQKIFLSIVVGGMLVSVPMIGSSAEQRMIIPSIAIEIA